MSDFKGRHFEGEIVLWAVRWYCRYGISYRDLEQMMAERGVSVDHSTIYRWVQRYAPEIEKRLRWHWRRPRAGSWRVDETYVKVRGKWAYLYRAVDKLGNTIDFYLSSTRNTMAAKRFLAKALRGLKDWEQPEVINTDKAPTYAAALDELKAEGKCPKDTQHREVKYLNNIHRGRPRQAQAAASAGARFQVDEDGKRDHQGLRGDACAPQGPGGDLQPHPRHPWRGALDRARFRPRPMRADRSRPAGR
jgi:transposase-like protein